MRLFRTTIMLLISVLPLRNGATQSTTWTPLPVLGGDAENRERLGQLLGGARREGFLLRSASEGLDSLPGAPGRLRWALLVPEVGALYNSAIPFSFNTPAGTAAPARRPQPVLDPVARGRVLDRSPTALR